MNGLGILGQWGVGALSLLGLFLSLWTVLSAPTLSLLLLGVAVPEMSPWLVGMNAIALAFLVGLLRAGRAVTPLLICNLLALVLSLLPLLQVRATQKEFSAALDAQLGSDYLQNVPAQVREALRPRPLVLWDVFRQIPLNPVRIERGIVFARPDGVPLTLNTYHPQKKGRYPGVIIIYGGAWRGGSPNNDENFSRYLANQGYAVISIDYRHAPEYQFPVQLEDVRTAISYIYDRAETLEVDRDRLAIMGRSAGAHLAMLAAYTSDTIPWRAVVNYYGPVDLKKGYNDLPFPDPLDIQAVLRDFLGGTPTEVPKQYEIASPWHYIRPDLPPSLLVYAGRDRLVKAQFGRDLYENLQRHNNQAILLEIPWSEHVFDAAFSGLGNQLALYYTERFLAWALYG